MNCYLINLDKRPDRLAKALKQFEQTDFEPIRVPAVDGSKLDKPEGWIKPMGAYGLWLTATKLLEDCIARDEETIAFFEDDLVFAKDFKSKYQTFTDSVSMHDWDILYLGGQWHMNNPGIEIVPGVYKTQGVHRTHAMLLSRQGCRKALDIWKRHKTHIDQSLVTEHSKLLCFAPKKWLVYQDAGLSDINGGIQTLRTFELKRKLDIKALVERKRIERKRR